MLEKIVCLTVVKLKPIGDGVGEGFFGKGRSKGIGQHLIEGRNDDVSLWFEGKYEKVGLIGVNALDFIQEHKIPTLPLLSEETCRRGIGFPFSNPHLRLGVDGNEKEQYDGKPFHVFSV